MMCPACGDATPPDASRCPACGGALVPDAPVAKEPPGRQPHGHGPDILHAQPGSQPLPPAGDMVATIIPYRNPKALAGYYAGFFAYIPGLGVPIAVAAILFGIFGVRHALAHPEAKGVGHAIIGIVLGSNALVCNPMYSLALWLFYSGRWI